MELLPSTNQFPNVGIQIPTELSTPHAVATRNRRPNLPKWKRRRKNTKLFSMVVVMALLGLRRHFNWLPPYRSGIRETVAKFIAGSWKSRPEAYGNLKTKQRRRKNSHRWLAYVAVYQSISQWASQASQLAGPWEKQSKATNKPSHQLNSRPPVMSNIVFGLIGFCGRWWWGLGFRLD